VPDTEFEVFIAYETPSGRIVGVHHGAADPGYNWKPTFDHGTHVEILRTSLPDSTAGKHYVVDVARKVLVETVDEQGVGFGFGPTGGAPARV
jgi:hypothetical protein